jgi:hypothetical protein
MQALILVNWWAILVSVIAVMIVGGLWYGPLFGARWAQGMGMDMSQKPDPKVMKRAFALQIFGAFLTAYVLTHTVNVWRPTAWSLDGDGSSFSYGFFGGFFVWLGFYVPMQLSKVAWENRPWTVFLINTGHDFVNLQIISQIVSHWY